MDSQLKSCPSIPAITNGNRRYHFTKVGAPTLESDLARWEKRKRDSHALNEKSLRFQRKLGM